MPTVSGGELVAQMLKGETVSAIFTLSGLHVAPIYAGCVDQGIQVIDTRHEQGAAHAADAYARLTRGIGVAVVTAGPGVTDAVTGVANAFAANSPLLLIGGAAPTFNAGKGSLQEIEQVDLFLRITKWADRVPSTQAIPAYLARAFRVALSGRPGPVFLEIPFDQLVNAVEAAEAPLPTGYRTKARSPGDPALVAEAAAKLDGAERPAVIAGSSIWFDDAVEPLKTLIERAGLLHLSQRCRRGVRFRPSTPTSSSTPARRRWPPPTWSWWWARPWISAWAMARPRPSRPMLR